MPLVYDGDELRYGAMECLGKDERQHFGMRHSAGVGAFGVGLHVERASVLIRGDKNNLITFDIKPGKIVINANSEMGKVEETVSSELEGKELKIAMNGKYLLDALKALSADTIVISFNTPVSPFTLENEGEGRSQYLILPVRAGNS